MKEIVAVNGVGISGSTVWAVDEIDRSDHPNPPLRLLSARPVPTTYTMGQQHRRILRHSSESRPESLRTRPLLR